MASESDSDTSVTSISVTDSSESESDGEDESWDSNTRVITLSYPHTSPLQGYYYKFDSDEYCSVVKKPKSRPVMRRHLTNSHTRVKLAAAWQNNQDFTISGVNLSTEPFKVCVIQDFLNSTVFYRELCHEYDRLKWNCRTTDLYELFQSADLSTIDDLSMVKEMHKLLCTDVRLWVQQITGLKLGKTSATCSYYSNTDYLLVHDDLREDRKIAFVLYFAYGIEQLEEKDGGALELFDIDKSGMPGDVVKSIWPRNNQFVFFPVSNESFHQVSELTNLEKCRFTINGWFHAAPVEDNQQEVPPCKSTTVSIPSDHILLRHGSPPIEMKLLQLSDWLNPDYLQVRHCADIQEYFGEHSEIMLKSFFRKGLVDEMYELLVGLPDNVWERFGPKTIGNYEILNCDAAKMPHELRDFLFMLQSPEMFSQMKLFTDLTLASIKLEVQRWTVGCYALLHSEFDWSKRELDVITFLARNNDNNTTSNEAHRCRICGAQTQYVCLEDSEQQALITVDPEPNNLNIIYRDTAKLVKYYSKQSPCKLFYTIVCIYGETL